MTDKVLRRSLFSLVWFPPQQQVPKAVLHIIRTYVADIQTGSRRSVGTSAFAMLRTVEMRARFMTLARGGVGRGNAPSYRRPSHSPDRLGSRKMVGDFRVSAMAMIISLRPVAGFPDAALAISGRSLCLLQ